MRKRTGLRNKYRDGRSTYSLKYKSRTADRYASCDKGKQSTSDQIAGHSLVWRKAEPESDKGS